MINDFLAKLPGFEQDFIYKLIAYQDLRLCLDVGAAGGLTTSWIKEAGSNLTKVIAFEPFPGNHSYFLERTRGLTRIELVKKAVSSQTGTSSFCVPTTIQGNEEGQEPGSHPRQWKEMLGYSSTGSLMKSAEDEPVYVGDGFHKLTVDTIAIADVVNTHVDFMKIDVQGGEYEVLLGCESVIREHGIDVMYVEFDGDRRIIEFLSALNYSIFDTDYLLIPKRDKRHLLDDIGFYDFKDLNLSTGRKAYRPKLSLNSGDYCGFFEEFRHEYGQIYTDLICVSSEFLLPFISNLSLFSKSYDIQGSVSGAEQATLGSLDGSIESFRSNCGLFS